MERINVDVEMLFTLDKNIYTNPDFTWPIERGSKIKQPVKNVETFFDYYMVSYIDYDYPIIKREADRTPENKEHYKGTIKFLENVVPDIRNSIQFTVLSDNDNIEKIQAKFNFGYYEQARIPEELFELTVMVAGVNRYKGDLKMIEEALERAKRNNQEVNIDAVNKVIQRFEYIVSIFENTTYNLTYDLEKKDNLQKTIKVKK